MKNLLRGLVEVGYFSKIEETFIEEFFEYCNIPIPKSSPESIRAIQDRWVEIQNGAQEGGGLDEASQKLNAIFLIAAIVGGYDRSINNDRTKMNIVLVYILKNRAKIPTQSS